MLADILDSAEFVRVIDFLLDDPERECSKTDLSEGARVSRPTLYKMWDRLELLNIVRPTRRFGQTELFTLNTQSELVKSLLTFDNELSKVMAKVGISSPEPRRVTAPTQRELNKARIEQQLREQALSTSAAALARWLERWYWSQKGTPQLEPPEAKRLYSLLESSVKE